MAMSMTAQNTKVPQARSAVRAMYVGLVLTVAATIVPLVDHATNDVLAAHIRAGYPDYADSRIDTAVTTYLIYLSVLGALGVLAWLWTIRAVKAGRWWPRATATTVFVLATSIALTNLLIRDTSGDTGLPPLLGWVGILPCVAGLVAVLRMWQR